MIKGSKATRGHRILDMCERWQDSSHDWDQDCQHVSAYYSLKKMETEEDQQTAGLVQHHNYGIGRDVLKTAKDEEFAFFEAPRVLMNFRLKKFDGSELEKERHEREFSRLVDQMVRENDPMFLDELEDMCDRKTLHGDVVMCWHPEGEDWRPFHGKILTEPDSPQNPYDDNFMRWAIYQEIQISDALEGIANDEPGWTDQAKPFLKAFYKAKMKELESEGLSFEQILTSLRRDSPEEYDFFAGGGGTYRGYNGPEEWDAVTRNFYSSTLKVFYLYEKDFSKSEEGRVPINLSIVSRVELLKGKKEDGAVLPDPLLYYMEEAFEDVTRAIHEFIQDSSLGVKDKTWNTIKGLGHLNYEADRMVNFLTSSMVNSGIDRNTPLWEVGDGSDTRKIEQFIKNGFQAYSLIPEGLRIQDKQKIGMSIGDSITAIQSIQGISQRNAIGQTGQSQAPSDELVFNAQRRSAQDTRVSNNRGRGNSRKILRFLKELGRRICQEITEQNFDGRPKRQIEALIKELNDAAIRWEWFFPENVVVTYPRLSGDGDPNLRRQIANENVSQIGIFPPESRQGILVEWYASRTDDWDKAEEIFMNQEASASQVTMAMDKLATMMVLGNPVPPVRDDVPESQIPVMLQFMVSQVQQGNQQGAFTPQQYQGMVAIGQHVMQLISLMEQTGQTQAANTFAQELQRISVEAQGPANALQQQQQANQSPELQMEARELALKERAQQLKEASFEVDVQKAQARQEGQDRRAAFNEFNQGSYLALKESDQNLKHQLAVMKEDRERLKLELEALRQREQR